MNAALENSLETRPVRRVLIVGVSSYIGSALAVSLKDDYEVFGTYLNSPTRIEGVSAFRLECTDGNEILKHIKRLSPEVILYCAGLTHRDQCQQEPGKADVVNFKAPTIFFKLITSDIRFVYFSVDEAYGIPREGQSTPYKEEDQGESSVGLCQN